MKTLMSVLVALGIMAIAVEAQRIGRPPHPKALNPWVLGNDCVDSLSVTDDGITATVTESDGEVCFQASGIPEFSPVSIFLEPDDTLTLVFDPPTVGFGIACSGTEPGGTFKWTCWSADHPFNVLSFVSEAPYPTVHELAAAGGHPEPIAWNICMVSGVAYVDKFHFFGPEE